MMVKMGSLTFLCELYNVGVTSNRGNRMRMEDAYAVAQDLGMDSLLKSSVYAVIDGHGGDWCAKFLKCDYLLFIIEYLKKEIANSDLEKKKISAIMKSAFTKMFKGID